MYEYKYLMICYSIHDEEIVKHEIFDTDYEAYSFIETDVKQMYNDMYMSFFWEDEYKLELDFTDLRGAYLFAGNYSWKWIMIPIRVNFGMELRL